MKLLTADKVKLGFIGLGNMGNRIAKRLLDHGYQLTAYDLDAAKAQALAAQGGRVAKNISEAVESSDVALPPASPTMKQSRAFFQDPKECLPPPGRGPSCWR